MVVVSTLAIGIVIGVVACAIVVLIFDIVNRDNRMDVKALVKATAAEAKEIALTTCANLATYVIHDEDGVKFLLAVNAEVKRSHAVLEARKREYMEPLKKLIALVQEDADPVLAELKALERAIKDKIVAYRNDVVRLRVEREQQARALLQAPASTTAPTAAPTQEQQRDALIAVSKTTVPKVDGVSYQDNWIAVVENQAIVPDRFWIRVISQALIDADVKAQVDAAKKAEQPPSPKIEGVKITNNVIIRQKI